MQSSISSVVPMPSLHQPQPLAPDGLEKAVGDEGVDLLADADGLHAQHRVKRHRPLDHARVRPLARHDLDQRQKVDRVEGVRDDEPAGVPHRRLQIGRLVARGRRGDDPVRVRRLELGIDPVLQLDSLGHRLDDQFDPFHGLGDRSGQPPAALGRPRRQCQPAIGALGILQHGGDLSPGLRIGIMDAHLYPVLDQPGQPARRR